MVRYMFRQAELASGVSLSRVICSRTTVGTA